MVFVKTCSKFYINPDNIEYINVYDDGKVYSISIFTTNETCIWLGQYRSLKIAEEAVKTLLDEIGQSVFEFVPELN